METEHGRPAAAAESQAQGTEANTKPSECPDLPDERDVLETAMEAGNLLLENGAEISRVEETMDRIARHYGVEESQFYILSNGSFVTSARFARVHSIKLHTADFSRVAAVNQLSREIVQGMHTLPEARKILSGIRTMPPPPDWQQILASGIGSAGFCYMFGGAAADCFAALLIGLALYAVLLRLPHTTSKITGNLIGGLLVAALCLIFRLALPQLQPGCIIIGSIFPLVPGVPFTNGIRDMAYGDYLSGTIRMLDALLVFISIAGGVAFSLLAERTLTGQVLAIYAVDPEMTYIFNYAAQAFAAAVGGAGFAVLYSVPARYIPLCAAVSGGAWAVYLVISVLSALGAGFAIFVAAVFVVLTSRFASVAERCPATIFLIIGIFPLVPGGGIFWATYYLVAGRYADAWTAGMSALSAAVAIVAAIVLVFELPERLFHLRTNSHSEPAHTL